MPDDTKKPGKEDRLRINVNQMFERRALLKRFKGVITEKGLRQGVREAGPMVADVKEWLIDVIENA